MIMTDHPGWLRTDDGIAYRALAARGSAALITVACDDAGDYMISVGGGEYRMDTVVPSLCLAGPADLVEPLKAAGPVARVANPSLWDALSAALMRQVIQAGHARTRYIRFCTAYGEPVSRDGLTASLFPSPERILDLSDEQFRQVGAAFPKCALRAAARAFLAQGSQWEKLPPAELVTTLQTIDRVGGWTARTAVADYTNDFSFYDYSDIAVQPAARRLNPDRQWPQGARAFKAAWEELAGDQLSAWTLLTLAWGINNGKTLQRAGVC
ncbi:hypothetical protein [Nocardia gipuzkoensis]|uniref:hypothetical protein n=1 Tax=Nocardia gipuzkoensis TaxID=2749991 RepID=UPI00237D5DD5|nr:hypothetical protein [Nocardia gipuzkoensis]MDE1675209.1 hypothetical protein [Nocardia gipuzkoensis]